jgi:hypothetical protein
LLQAPDIEFDRQDDGKFDHLSSFVDFRPVSPDESSEESSDDDYSVLPLSDKTRSLKRPEQGFSTRKITDK